MKFVLIKRNNQRGQSIVEFVVSLFGFLTIFFMFVQMSLSFGVSNFIQYATFMSARAYMAGYRSVNDQRKAAEETMNQLMTSGEGGDRFVNIITKDGDAPFIGAVAGATGKTPDARSKAWEQGVTYKFKARLYMLPLVKSASGNNFVELESQSWLGREPTEDECLSYMTKEGPAKQKVTGKVFLFDNGC